MSTTSHTYRVTGMTCEHCVRAVTTELQALDPVTDVSVALQSGEVTVASTRPLTDAEVVAAVDEAGYQVVS